MIAPALIGLLMAAEVPPGLMASSDAADMAYVQCLLSVVREANKVRISQSAFEQRLGASCRAEERAQRALGVRVLRLRGDPAPEQSADLLDRQIRQGMIDDYRALPEKQRLFEQLNALCRAKPEECR